jgi:hypothetical protein
VYVPHETLFVCTISSFAWRDSFLLQSKGGSARLVGKMKEREYLRLKRQIEDDCRQKLNALELVWRMAQESGNNDPVAPDGIKRGDLQNAILRAIGMFSTDFTAEQMLAKIRVSDPEIGGKAKASSVSSALKRMDGNEIETVIRGLGRKPSVYRVRTAELKIVGS